jgi:hypothetical protein
MSSGREVENMYSLSPILGLSKALLNGSKPPAGTGPAPTQEEAGEIWAEIPRCSWVDARRFVIPNGPGSKQEEKEN